MLQHFVGASSQACRHSPVNDVSDRELEVLRHMGEGNAPRQISEALQGLSLLSQPAGGAHEIVVYCGVFDPRCSRSRLARQPSGYQALHTGQHDVMRTQP